MSKKVYEETVGSVREQREPPGTISLETARGLLRDPNLTDQEVEEIKEQVRLMVEIIYEKCQWRLKMSHFGR